MSRLSEFLWQEGHTAHDDEEGARTETMQMLTIYKEVVEGLLAIPVYDGQKTPLERRIDKAFICGYSTGGTIVLEYLLTNANRALGGIVISGMSEVKDFYLKQRISLAIKLIEVKAFPLLSMAITWGNSDKQETYKRLYVLLVKERKIMMTIINKLNLDKYSNIAVLHQPDDYDLFDGLHALVRSGQAECLVSFQ